MTRLHVHIATDDLDDSIAFYTRLLGQGPSKRERDYAKWLLDAPGLNLSLSARGEPPGLRHLGVQTEDRGELDALRERIEPNASTLEEECTTCCYAVSDKTWLRDPQAVVWELFHSHGEASGYYDDTSEQCCASA